MNVVEGILKEEEERLEMLQERRKADLAALPKGAVRVRTINGNEYLYQNFRQGDKVLSEYLCKKESEPGVLALENAAKKRKIKAELKEIQSELNSVRRALGKLRRK